MNRRHVAIQLAQLSFEAPTEQCDPAVARAVVVCLKSFKLSDSIHSEWPSRSIPMKIAKYVDPAFREFAQRQLFLPSGWTDLSELMLLQMGDADERLNEWRKALFAVGEMLDVGAAPGQLGQDLNPGAFARHHLQVVSTIATLRNFTRVCHMYWSTRRPAKTVDARGLVDDAQRRLSRRKPASNSRLFWMLDHEPWCQLCCDRTEREQQRVKWIAKGKLSHHDEMARQSELSESFCTAHLSKTPLYERDHDRQVEFYAVMRLIIEVRSAMDLRPLDPESRRSVAHALVMESPRVPKSVKAWTQYLVRLPESAELRTPALREQLLTFHALIVHEAKSRKFNLIRAMRRGIENRNDILKRLCEAGAQVSI